MGLTFVECYCAGCSVLHDLKFLRSVSFSLFLQMAREERELICPGSHGKGLKLLFLSSLSDYKVIPHSTGVLPKDSDLSGRIRCVALLSSGEKGALSASRFSLWETVDILGLPPGTHHVVPECDGHLGMTTF